MVKFSDGSPEYRVVIRFMESLLPVTPADATVVLGSEHVEAGDGQGSSRPRKSKEQKVLNGRSSGFAADSSRAFESLILPALDLPFCTASEPGLYAKPNSKKRHRGRGRKNAAMVKENAAEAEENAAKEKEKNLKGIQLL